MNDIILSIIIPVYNAQNNIKKLVESFRLFKYRKQLEVICVDDGSSDKSYEILASLNEEYLRVIPQEHRGVSAARNTGLTVASGRYITFVDADDEVAIDVFENVMKKAIVKDSDITIFGIRDIFYKNNEKISEHDNFSEDANYNERNFFLKIGEILNKDILYSPCNKIYKNAIIKEHKIAFDERCSIGEDMLFNLSYFHYIQSVQMVADYAYLYRHEVLNESGSSRYHDNYQEIVMKIYEELNALLKIKNVYEENKVDMHIFLLRKISASLNNAFTKNSVLSKKDKKRFIAGLYSDQRIVEALEDKQVTMKEIDQKMLVLLHRRHFKNCIYFLYSIRHLK